MQWAMAHPWLTFLLAALAIGVFDNVVANVLRVAVFLVERRGRGDKEDGDGDQ